MCLKHGQATLDRATRLAGTPFTGFSRRRSRRTSGSGRSFEGWSADAGHCLPFKNRSPFQRASQVHRQSRGGPTGSPLKRAVRFRSILNQRCRTRRKTAGLQALSRRTSGLKRPDIGRRPHPGCENSTIPPFENSQKQTCTPPGLTRSIVWHSYTALAQMYTRVGDMG